MEQGSQETQHKKHRRKTCSTCDDYSKPQPGRNNYFTGKMLVERDFTDEQHYHMGKQLRHARHLHGFGTVCGLKVKPHPNDNCRHQYVVIEPGTAIDCCGRELLVTQKEYFDFAAKIAEKKVDLGTQAHTLQICLRYSECPAEQVPVLFDDCNSSDTTQPNRIIEGYDFDVRIDPILKHKVLDDVDLEWKHAQAIAHAKRIVVDEAHHRFYVLTADDDQASALFVYSTHSPYSLLGTQTFDVPAMDLALSLNGSRIYVSVKDEDSVQVLDTYALGTAKALINELPSSGVPEGDVRLAVSPRDGFLYVLDTAKETVTVWSPSINRKRDDDDDEHRHHRHHEDHDDDDDDDEHRHHRHHEDHDDDDDDDEHRHHRYHRHYKVGKAPHSIIASPDGKWVLVANSGDETISAIDAVTYAHHLVTLQLNNITPAELAIAETDDGLKLYILDTSNNTVSILLLELRANPPFTLLGRPYLLASGTAVDIAASHTGRWLFVLLKGENARGRLQVIDAHKVERKDPYAAGDWLHVGYNPRRLVLVPTRPHLYVAYWGKAPDISGGVAIIHLLETTCEDLFKRALHDCDDCDDDDDECIVLATIKGYTAGSEIEEHAIDNFTDRRLLPSVDLVTDVVRCILDNGGGKGRRGEEGPRGKEGRGIEAVKAHIVDCDDEGSARLEEIDEKLTLVLKIPRGCDADVPPEVEYTRICAINWEHRGKMKREAFEEGLLIAFNHKIRARDINAHTFQLLIRTENEDGWIDWRELPHKQLRGIELELARGEPHGTCQIIGREEEEEGRYDADAFVNGALFQIKEIPEDIREDLSLRVVLKGDFIRDERGLGVDGNHLPPWLPHRASGDGVGGGTFESWFTVEEDEDDDYMNRRDRERRDRDGRQGRPRRRS